MERARLKGMGARNDGLLPVAEMGYMIGDALLLTDLP
jgi:hypothetical protein